MVRAISPTGASRTSTKKTLCKLHKQHGSANPGVSPNWPSNCFSHCFLRGPVPEGDRKQTSFRQHRASQDLSAPGSYCVKGLAPSSHKVFNSGQDQGRASESRASHPFLPAAAWLAARDTEEGSSERFSVRVNAGPQRKGMGGKSNQLDSGLIATSRGRDSAPRRDVVEQPPGRSCSSVLMGSLRGGNSPSSSFGVGASWE